MKTIPEFPDYKITKDGRVWSNPGKGGGTNIGKYLKFGKNIGGYLQIGLYKNGKCYRRTIHRLVLETYVGPCPEGMEACHNNGIKTDNRLENLRWDIRKANHQDAIKHGTHSGFLSSAKQEGEVNKMSKLTNDQVRLIFDSYHDGAYTQQELADYFNVCKMQILRIVNKQAWKHIWSV